MVQNTFAKKSIIYDYCNDLSYSRFSTRVSGKRAGKKKNETDERKPYGFNKWVSSPRRGILCVVKNIHGNNLMILPLANVKFAEKYLNPFVDYDGSLVPLTNKDGSPFFREDLTVEESYKKLKLHNGEYSILTPAEAYCFWYITGANRLPPTTNIGFYRGFFIGEGSLGYVSTNNRQSLSFTIKVTINYEGINILLGFQQLCNGRGHIYTSSNLKNNKKRLDWYCDNTEDLLYKVIPALDKLPLVGVKKEQYALWKSHFLFKVKHSRIRTGKNKNDRKDIDIYNSYSSKMAIIDKTPTGPIDPREIHPGLLSGLVRSDGGIKVIYLDSRSGVLNWWIHFRQHKNSKALLEAVKIAWLAHMNLPRNSAVAIGRNTATVFVFILKNKELRKAFSRYMDEYPLYSPRLHYELTYLDTFLQKLPTTKWNYVPIEIKLLSKTIIEHLRPADETKKYDFFYPGAFTLLLSIRNLLSKKVGTNFLPYSLSKLLPTLEVFPKKDLLAMINYIENLTDPLLICPVKRDRKRKILVIPDNAELPIDIPVTKSSIYFFSSIYYVTIYSVLFF